MNKHTKLPHNYMLNVFNCYIMIAVWPAQEDYSNGTCKNGNVIEMEIQNGNLIALV